MSVTLEDLRAAAISGAEDVRPTLRPDGDWSPVLLLSTGDDIVVVGIDGRGLDDKQEFAKTIARAVATLEAKAAALVVTAWMLVVERDKEDDYVPGQSLADHPRRTEVVNVLTADESSCEIVTAEITRHPDAPPTLGEWSPPADGPSIGGLMSDAVRIGLELARMLRAT